ncbi:hypothetical protein PIB30_110545, partial [Stylosanthes scabra]|nr:hypothetical protein [Stylosanthes scabra]
LENDTPPALDLPIKEEFPDEQLLQVHMTPWFADIANFKAIRMIPPHFTKNQRRKLMHDANYFSYGMNHTYSRDVQTTFFKDVFPKKNRGVCYGIVM